MNSRSDSPRAEDARRQPIWEHIIEPKGRIGFELAKGQVLRIVDLDGQQVADFICFNKHDLGEKISIHTTIMLNGNIHVGIGSTVFSDDARPMLKVLADTVGRHDLLAGTCCRGLNRLRYGVEDGPNCRASLAAVMEPHGVSYREIPYTFNVFMNVPVQADGAIGVEAPLSRAGDHIDLEAQMDLVVAISNCPQERNICNGFEATRLGLSIFEGAGA
ncbi:urea carboxylase-associated family protein [Ancylobacter sp. MQZ15Z-1]|uniref:Urea carboxylase-associated family protein n=1 Tax=Ancylobacter mangrovi TaxID=2972472 RepID=A0A9X2T3F5_9HYPH|nr:urea carboxylase-associated family protein [Ancylobacter mangrovi]MCS0497285.1 urea carboxylase-associated family protein [Ancylobacter mangrovi]